MRAFAPFALPAALLFFSGCPESHGAEPDGGERDAGRDAPAPLDAGGRRDGEVDDAGSRDAGVEPPPGVAVCGGTVCAPGETCCTATGACFDPADAAACVVPPAETAPGACASNADCAAGEICEAFDIFASDGSAHLCVGVVGRCVPTRGPESCGGFGDGVCGCDGRTYRDPCQASRAGVRVAWAVPCGTPVNGGMHFTCTEEAQFCFDGTCDVARGECVFPNTVYACGIDAQCPPGLSCCGLTGLCVDPSCAHCCEVPPEGTLLPCGADADCAAFIQTGPGGDTGWYCAGDGCGPAGGCDRRPRSCDGVLSPVCGCDGLTYTNACWAASGGVRVAHDGECG